MTWRSKTVVIAGTVLLAVSLILAQSVARHFARIIYLGEGDAVDRFLCIWLTGGIANENCDEWLKWDEAADRFEFSNDLHTDAQFSMCDGTAADCAITFDLDTDQTITWHEASDRFEFSNDLHTHEQISLCDGTAADCSITFDLDSDQTLTWDESESAFAFSKNFAFCDGTAADCTLTFDLDTDQTLQWDESADAFKLSKDFWIAEASPQLAFDDTDVTAATEIDAVFSAFILDATGGDEQSAFRVAALSNGTSTNVVDFYAIEGAVNTTDEEGALKLWWNSTMASGLISYSGFTGAAYDMSFSGDPQHYRFAEDVIPSVDNDSDLGDNGLTLWWKDLYLKGRAYFDSTSGYVEDSDADGLIEFSGVEGLTTTVPIVFSSYLGDNTRFLNHRFHGNFISLATAQTINPTPTSINVTEGIGKLLVVLNTCSDSAGSITVTGTSVNRDTKAETGADTDTLTIAGLTTDSTSTDAQSNNVWAMTDAYMTSKWFKGAVTLSTSDVNCTDVDVYQIAFEQVNDQTGLSLTTLDITADITNASGWIYGYVYLIEAEAQADQFTITNAASVSIDPPTANKTYRLRHGALADAFDGTTDGFWAEVHFGGATPYIENFNMKVWVDQTIDVE